jgi:phage terminase large subunit GpA-like protein
MVAVPLTKCELQIIRGFVDGMRPEPRITVSEWADKNRYLESKSSAEPGLYRTTRTPYVREIADNLSVTSIVRYIVVMKGAQVGLTELGNNWIGYIIDCAPGPILSVQPTDDMVERNSKMRIAPMIEACPTLRAKIKPARSRDSGNTLKQKEFPGGVLIMASGGSAAGLRSMPARFAMADECDAFPEDVDGEGSPMSLIEKRTSTFSNKKYLKISTPTLQGSSIIEAEFLLTDQRYFFVPCPHCGSLQTLQFKQFRWTPGKYDTVYYECEHCTEAIQERFKGEMLKGGEWIATAPGNASPYTVGYHVSALYSPPGWKSWPEIVEEWEKAQGDENKLKSFYNTVLGETYKVKTDAPEWEKLFERAEDYQLNKAFKDVVVITAGADVQADRIEIEIVGWMEGRKSQQLDYRVLMGDTSKAEVWLELDKIIGETWEREDGAFLPLRLMAIDSGYNSANVYAWSRKHGFSKVVPIKGQEKLQQFFSPPRAVDTVKHGKKIGKQKIWHIGVNFIKEETYGFFRQTINPENGVVPNGYCHFPKREPHYFRGITAEVVQEQRVSKARGLTKKFVWVKKYERNEPLDCRVYARAASAIVGIDNWKSDRWERERQLAQASRPAPQVKPQETQATPEPQATTTPAPAQQKTKTAKKNINQGPKKSYWNRNK